MTQEFSLPVCVENYCTKQPIKLTTIRLLLLSYLWQKKKPVKAYDLIEVLVKNEVGAPKPSTIYRTLGYLSKFGLVHKIHSINAYVPCAHPGEHSDCHLLICKVCHSTKEFCSEELGEIIPQKTKEAGFFLSNSMVEVHGICNACQAVDF